jgi:protein involved in polysaccharide export with SLBB domain
VETADNSLDPSRYFIGGGDEFFISIVGNSSIKFIGVINQQGDLYISELGLKKLGKISLAEAQKKISEFIQTKLKKPCDVSVSMLKSKKATVSVNGAVANAGTYTMPGAFRVLDVIRLANNNLLPSMNECNFREVRCTNKDSTEIIDLFTYLLQNNIAGNPYIYPGDNFTIEYATKRVFINAAIKSVVKGWIPVRKNETLAGLLSLLTFDESVDTSMIFFQSATDGNSPVLRSVSWKDASSITLQDRDIITIPQKKNYTPFFMVTISGEVVRPGSYPIVRDSTTVEDVLAMAGNFSQYADEKRTIIVRRSRILDQKVTDTIGPSIVQFPPGSQEKGGLPLRPEMSSGLLKMNSINDYSIIAVNKNRMSIRLFAYDNIIVPRKDAFVYISGNVKRPGAYEFDSGKSYKYYISKAGGYTGKADKGNLFGIRTYGAVSQIVDLSEIYQGDIIVVPDSQQAKFLTTILLPIIAAVAGIASVILGIYSVSRH